MKILHVTASYRPSINGVAISVANLKNNLEKLGHKVLVLAPENENADKVEKGIARYPSIANPLVKDYPIPLSPLTVKTLKRVSAFKPDIIHVHHPFHIGWFARVLAQRLNVPLVYTYHTRYGYHVNKFLEFLPQSLKPKFVGNSVAEFCRKADLIIAPSGVIKTNLEKRRKLRDRKIVVIPSIVDDLTKERKSKEDLRKMYGYPRDKKILLSVARLSKEKNPEMLLKTLKLLPSDFILIVCGSGHLEDKLKNQAERFRIAERVFFVGKVKRRNLGVYYQMADFFVNVSESETQGIVFWEAARFGLPVVSVESKVAKEWVKPEFGELVGNKALIVSAAIKRLSGKNYSKISAKAVSFSRKFSGLKSTRQMIKQYEDAVKHKKLHKE